MIDRGHDLPIARQAKALGISRGSVYYLPRPVSAGDLAVMRRMDELHLELPFAGSRMLRDLLNKEGIATGRTIDRSAMAAAILRELDARYADINRRFDQLVAETTRRSVLLGRWVQVRAGDSIIEGVAESLNADGQLLLRTGDGSLATLSAGEVSISQTPL